MREGHFIHRYILDSIQHIAQTLGATTTREYQDIDLFIEQGSKRIAVECERTSKRIESDCKKCKNKCVEATHLIILVPNYVVAEAVKRKLERLGINPKTHDPRIDVLVLPQAVKLLRSDLQA